ncbi:hypothetical protein [Pseudotabrizicola sediminis]|uniref:hypothetical protein n=1 Tax=Pseudotabrizicola sediminis TaxID=2486418 RepID=UPI001081C070|nr:hypothetical protein [Pseudotabrizicola sediminis]
MVISFILVQVQVNAPQRLWQINVAAEVGFPANLNMPPKIRLQAAALEMRSWCRTDCSCILDPPVNLTGLSFDFAQRPSQSKIALPLGFSTEPDGGYRVVGSHRSGQASHCLTAKDFRRSAKDVQNE